MLSKGFVGLVLLLFISLAFADNEKDAMSNLIKNQQGSTIDIDDSGLVEEGNVASDEVNVYADNQKIDALNKQIVWEGNVKITQRTLEIVGDRVVLDGSRGKGSEVFTAFGNLATFYDILEDGSPISAQAKIITYDVNSKKINLNGNVRVEQRQSTVTAEQIEYDSENETIVANGSDEGSNRVQTVIKLDK